MALTDKMEFAAITIKADGALEVRMDRVISDGVDELGRKPQRSIYTPDMDPIGFPPKVRAIANLVWTAQVKSDWAAAHPVVVTQ